MQMYLLTVVATILLGGNFALNKQYQKTAGSSSWAALRYVALLSVCTSVLFLVLDGFRIHITGYSMLLAALQALCTLSYTLLGFRIIAQRNVALYTLFLMAGGMLVPYVWGVIFLSEPISVLRVAGIAMILAAMVISNATPGKLDWIQILLCLSVFIINGFCSIFSKMHQIAVDYPTVDTKTFVMLSGIFRTLLSCLALLFTKKPQDESPVSLWKILPIISISALVGGVSYLFQLMGAQHLPATVLYPLITGGAIIFSALANWIFFRDRLTKRLLIGIVLCCIGTCMFL